VTARVLRDFPNINASVFGSNLVLRKEVNIGCAVALSDESLVVPVIQGADRRGFAEIAQDLERLIRLARTKQLKRDDVEGGTFSISNFGAFGSLIGTPIIYQPQVAILGMGAVFKAPAVVDGQVCGARPALPELFLRPPRDRRRDGRPFPQCHPDPDRVADREKPRDGTALGGPGIVQPPKAKARQRRGNNVSVT
jgi:2-oxoglutarate dehydrogenase E2 component (dihydrolipoamide succinyltransferase)